MSTPAGRSSFISASIVCGVDFTISMSRLWTRISNCSRDFLSTCGERSTVYTVRAVGSGIGPAVRAPVRFAVATISPADLSRIAWSYDRRRIRIRCPCAVPAIRLLRDLGDDAGADGAAALANREPKL